MFNRKGGEENLGPPEGGGNLRGESNPLAAEGGRKKINNDLFLRSLGRLYHADPLTEEFQVFWVHSDG